jgi:hypothetical protein
MAVDVSALIARYPEFTATVTEYPDMVDACIAEAVSRISSAYFGTRTDMAVKALAAHLIAINPLGEMARIQMKDGSTTYLQDYQRIRRGISTGFRVI